MRCHATVENHRRSWQAIDLDEFFQMPSKVAKPVDARRIKHLARLAAGFAQSYPQFE
jgi:hypothetical protein